MDVITLAIIGFVAIAGPTILALMLYWRDHPDQRPSWRRALEHAVTPTPSSSRVRIGGSRGGPLVGSGAAAVATTAAAVPAEVGRCGPILTEL
jgi:hypothetical protein